MIIYGRYEFLLKMCGLHPEGGRNNVIPRITFSVVFVLFNLLVSTLFIFNFRRDIHQALQILPIILGSGSLFATYFHLLIYRDQFHSFLGEMEDIVQESEYHYYHCHECVCADRDWMLISKEQGKTK